MKSSSKDKDSFFRFLSGSIGRGGLYILGGKGDKNLPAWKVTLEGSFPSLILHRRGRFEDFKNSVVKCGAL